MSLYVIWVDRENAKVFKFSEQKMERRKFASKYTDHHTHAADSIELQRREKVFFGPVVENISDASRILILGPGVAKHHFQNYLSEHFPALGKKVAACETLDHPTDPQIAALAQKFLSLSA